jgi:hypothetical protein
LGATLAVSVACLSACSLFDRHSQPSAAAALDAYAQEWSRRDWQAMEKLVYRRPSSFVSDNEDVFDDLGVTHASVTSSPPRQKGTVAAATFTEDLVLGSLGPLRLTAPVHLELLRDHWYISWSTATIDPALGPGDKFGVTLTWPQRAPILGTNHRVLTDLQAPTVVIGVEGRFIKNAASLTKILVDSGAAASAAASAVKAAEANPELFESVLTVTQARYNQLRPTIYPVPGTVFQQEGGDTPSDTGLIPVLGTLGPITPAELKRLGPPYSSQDVVGQSGLEAAYQEQLAGSPGGVVTITGPDGNVVRTVATYPEHAGSPVMTSINPTIQAAAESVLAGGTRQAALVAVDTKSGQVEAVANELTGSFDLALAGEQPPGSTFKVVTSTALFAKGLTPESTATCPATINVDGEILHNADDEAPVQDVIQAFTESCNTAFIGLAVDNLTASSLNQAALVYDIGDNPEDGVRSFGGSVPIDDGATAVAESAIGQGQVVVSPLDLAMAAAAIDSGTVREPRLVVGAPDDSSPGRHLSPTWDQYLHQMMLSVVEFGTAAGTGLPPGTYAKTGTAEYGSGNPLPVDAWLMGFNGSTAFCMLIVNAPGEGGPTDGPLVARFLDAIDASS